MSKIKEEELSRSPSEVFEIVSKLGKGSYGSVFKARHKSNGNIIAVKKVPVDSDLSDIVKEISIMQQCDCPHIVKCFGSLFDDLDLWICMEYCGAGSVADIIRLRDKPLEEDEIITILKYSLYGLEYLHKMRKIHRDIKAGNILLTNEGVAKLADFGVAGQLCDASAKRNTVIGTPYWMAPEIIQEIGYNCSADIWSLGITTIEMADGKPPLGDMHPMRALFMIPSHPSPTLRRPLDWTTAFKNFVASCLLKAPDSRPTASDLLQSEFIQSAKPCNILIPIIKEVNVLREKRLQSEASELAAKSGAAAQSQTATKAASSVSTSSDCLGDTGTMIRHNTDNPNRASDTLISLDSADHGTGMSDGTMVINATSEEDEPDVGPARASKPKEKSGDTLKRRLNKEAADANENAQVPQRPFAPFSKILQQSGFIGGGGVNEPGGWNHLTYEQLEQVLASLNRELHTELQNLAVRYRHKRQPLLDAINAKSMAASNNQ